MSPKDMLKLDRIWPKPLAMRMASAVEMQEVVDEEIVVFEDLEVVLKGWMV